MSEDAARLDLYLWRIRAVKTRALAQKLCTKGAVRINGVRVEKAHRLVRVGDVLTVPMANTIRLIRVISLGERRGPASAAALLYEDLPPA